MKEVRDIHDKKRNSINFADHTVDLQKFHELLLTWWQNNKRTFPWRDTHNPFHLLISEMMLRRTKADQVVSIYSNFIKNYPDPVSLATASIKSLEIELYSLGLAWRVPAFQQLAHILLEEYNGLVPDNYRTLTQLPGVGDYVASAVCSFAFKQPIPIIDTNIVRIVGRLFDISVHAKSRRQKPIRDLIYSLLDHDNPKQYNYALLDLAALICKPRDPDCPNCPLLILCKTGQRRVENSCIEK